jgi:hypothetical protein
MSDNVDATPSLGYSKVLSVQDSVGPPIPELPQRSEEGSKSPPSVNRQDARDVLPYHPCGPIACKNRKIDEHEVATWIIQAGSEASDGE